jgi:hypothetical protein
MILIQFRIQIRIRIHNLELRIRILQKVSDPYGSGSTTLLLILPFHCADLLHGRGKVSCTAFGTKGDKFLLQLQRSGNRNKGAGILLNVLHVCYSFRQKCSKLGTHTTQGLKNNFYLRCFSISSGPKPRITDEYFQFFF